MLLQLTTDYSFQPRRSQHFFDQMSIRPLERLHFYNAPLSFMNDVYNQITPITSPLLHLWKDVAQNEF